MKSKRPRHQRTAESMSNNTSNGPVFQQCGDTDSYFPEKSIWVNWFCSFFIFSLSFSQWSSHFGESFILNRKFKRHFCSLSILSEPERLYYYIIGYWFQICCHPVLPCLQSSRAACAHSISPPWNQQRQAFISHLHLNQAGWAGKLELMSSVEEEQQAREATDHQVFNQGGLLITSLVQIYACKQKVCFHLKSFNVIWIVVQITVAYVQEKRR